MSESDQPPTKRSCECAILRHQLELADQLAAQIAPRVAFVKSTCAANGMAPNDSDQALLDAFARYSSARVSIESGLGVQ